MWNTVCVIVSYLLICKFYHEWEIVYVVGKRTQNRIITDVAFISLHDTAELVADVPYTQIFRTFTRLSMPPPHPNEMFGSISIALRIYRRLNAYRELAFVLYAENLPLTTRCQSAIATN